MILKNENYSQKIEEEVSGEAVVVSASAIQKRFDTFFTKSDYREPNTAAPALLTTNELLESQVISNIIDSTKKPDGVLISVGCGMTWVLTQLFTDHDPQLVLGFDYDVRVVLLGRILVELMKRADGYEHFLLLIKDQVIWYEVFKTVIDQVATAELQEKLSAVFQQELREMVLEEIRVSQLREGDHLATNVGTFFQQRLERLCLLAKADKIAFVFLDLLAESSAELLYEVSPNTMNHVVYTSNVQDYIGVRKLDYLNRIPGWHLSAGSSTGYKVEAKYKGRMSSSNILSRIQQRLRGRWRV